MVEIIEVKGWGAANGLVVAVEVKSLEVLKGLAESLKSPVIMKKGEKEYLLVHEGVWYHYKG